MASYNERQVIFERVLNELTKVLASDWHGSLMEAAEIANAATMAARVLNGAYDISNMSFKVTTAEEDEQK